jgi:hypothetical protein
MNRALVARAEGRPIELHRALLHDDPVAAVEFVKRHIAPQIAQKGTAPGGSSRLDPFMLPGRSNEGRRAGG